MCLLSLFLDYELQESKLKDEGNMEEKQISGESGTRKQGPCSTYRGKLLCLLENLYVLLEHKVRTRFLYVVLEKNV